MTVYKWSQTADNNASSDSTINWVEGQAPSTVNNSARAVMAGVAKWCADISGRTPTSTGGTNTAYQFTSAQGFDSLPHMDGAMLSIKFDKTNIAGSPSVTLNVDGLGAKPIRVSPGVELASGALVVGVSYGITYSNTDGVWYLQDGALAVATQLAPILVPIGGVIMWMGSSPPSSSWAWCNGTTLTVSSYPALAAVLPAAFVSGGIITLPNLCEVLPYGVAGMGGVAGRGSTVTNSQTLPNAANWNKLGAGAPAGFIGESAHVLTSNESRKHTHTLTPNVSISDGRSWSFPQGTDGGTTQTGGGRVGLISGSTAITVSGSISITNNQSTSDGATGDDAIGFGDGAHNTTPPAYPIGFIIRVL